MGLFRTAGVSLCPKPGFRYFELIYAYQRTEATEMWLPHGSIAVPCTPFSDGALKSKYRNPGFGHSETPAVRHEPIYLLFFSVTLWLRGALLLLKSFHPTLSRTSPSPRCHTCRKPSRPRHVHC